MSNINRTSPVFTPVDRNLAESLFARLARETGVPGEGVCRPSYGRGETVAWQLMAEAAADLGLHTRADAAGNLVMSVHSEISPMPEIWVGSHLDAAPNGGNYDGLAGVIAALLMVAKARDQRTPRSIVGLGLRGEESAWFGVPYLGSRGILGKLHPHDLDRRRRMPDNDNGPTLRTYMELIGILPENLLGSPILIPGQVAEFWELHIEQGPLLTTRNKPIGIVTGIRGNIRAPDARVVGRANHSGTTPHQLRDDAVMRFVEIMTGLEARRQGFAALGADLVFTCGIVGTNPKKHSITTIADEVRLALEVRSLSDHHANNFMRYAAASGVDLGELIKTPAVKISPALWERVTRACVDLNIEHEVMPSGAGHDAAMFQEADIPSGMIFVRNKNGSHNPDESLDMDDFLLGCEVLWRTITPGA